LTKVPVEERAKLGTLPREKSPNKGFKFIEENSKKRPKQKGEGGGMTREKRFSCEGSGTERAGARKENTARKKASKDPRRGVLEKRKFTKQKSPQTESLKEYLQGSSKGEQLGGGGF